MLLSGIAILISIVALYKAYQSHKLASDATTLQVKNNLVTGFLEHLDASQLERLEMSFRYSVNMYKIQDILNGDYQLINSYNALLEALQVTDLKDYYTVIVQEISKRK